MHFTIAQGSDRLSSHSGLALVGEMLDGVSIGKRLDKVELKEHPCPKIDHGNVAKAMIGLIRVGKPDFDAIEPFRDDTLFATALGLDVVPSSPTLRQRLDSDNEALNDIVLEESAKLVQRFAADLTPVEESLYRSIPMSVRLTTGDFNINEVKHG